ncbi:hypothetical protein V6C32_05385 [Desulforamulus ruminis]|nr:hypothetical protein [Desulforamulus ruminis]
MKGQAMSNNKQQRVMTNVIILSDRLMGEAKKLSSFIYSCADNMNVLGIAANSQEVMQLAKNHFVDFLIIVGYLRDEKSYGVVQELYEQNKNYTPVHYAMLDSLIFDLCEQYNISLRFDRTLPKAEFIDYLEKYKNYKYQRDLKTQKKMTTSLKNKKPGNPWPGFFSKFLKLFLNFLP